MTGTPPGVRPVQPGDTMTVTVEGLGELEQSGAGGGRLTSPDSRR
ncbi:hypothetical protein [Nonomuraea rubra]